MPRSFFAIDDDRRANNGGRRIACDVPRSRTSFLARIPVADRRGMPRMRGSTATVSERSATDNARAARAHTHARARTHIYAHTLRFSLFPSFFFSVRTDGRRIVDVALLCMLPGDCSATERLYVYYRHLASRR